MLEKNKTVELKDEDLKSVVGGSTTEDAPDELSCDSWMFSGFVGKYAESHIGEILYLVSHGESPIN